MKVLRKREKKEGGAVKLDSRFVPKTAEGCGANVNRRHTDVSWVGKREGKREKRKIKIQF